MSDKTMGELCVKYGNAVESIVVKLMGGGNWGFEAQDVVQEVFRRFMSEAKPDLPEAQTEPYLCGMARNVVREWTRERHRDLHLIATSLPLGPVPSPDLALDREYLFNRVNQALSKLTPRQRQAMDLASDRNTSLAESARQAGLSASVLRRRIADARKNLIRELSGEMSRLLR